MVDGGLKRRLRSLGADGSSPGPTASGRSCTVIAQTTVGKKKKGENIIGLEGVVILMNHHLDPP